MLAQAYHWTLDDISKLSYPQVLLIQHAASYNRKVLDARLEDAKSKNQMTMTEELAEFGKPISQMTSEELMLAAGSEGGRPKVIKIKKDPPLDPED
jgi:hypothetical protein